MGAPRASASIEAVLLLQPSCVRASAVPGTDFAHKKLRRAACAYEHMTSTNNSARKGMSPVQQPTDCCLLDVLTMLGQHASQGLTLVPDLGGIDFGIAVLQHSVCDGLRVLPVHWA